MIKRIDALERGDIMIAFVYPDGRQEAVRGGALEVRSVESTGGSWEGQPQYEIRSAQLNRAARYANGATHAVVT